MTARHKFRLALLVWRGTQAAVPLLFARLLDDAEFNRFAATLSTVQVAAGVVGFGQAQFAYAQLRNQSAAESSRTPSSVLAIALVVALLCIIGLALIPNPVAAGSLWRAVGLVACAYGLMLVEIIATRQLLRDLAARAAGTYYLASFLFAVLVLPTLYTRDAGSLAWGGWAGALAGAWLWSNRDRHWPSPAEFRSQLAFGTAQTFILLASGAIPWMLHLLLPALGADLKGSKLVALFTLSSGVVLFVGTSAIAAASSEIARQSPAQASTSLRRALIRYASRALLVAPVALATTWLALGAPAWAVALCAWLFVTSQLVIVHSRYVLFSRIAIAWDLAANFGPLLLVVAAAIAADRWGYLSRGPELPIVLMTALAVLSAAHYVWALHHQAHRAVAS